jgi:D-cysteine desulfhydrase family pyridoxal phosphate-dependent enzyme
MTIAEVKALLGKKRRERIGFFPTPFYKLETLSSELGINLYIKRDDFTGPGLFGGNKIRKLEYLMGEAKLRGAESVFTYGAVQSNHAMLTVLACRKIGLKPVLYLGVIVEPDEDDVKSNLLLDKIMDAEIHIVRKGEGESVPEAMLRALEMGKRHIAGLEAQGRRCFDIPPGGASPVGAAGYIDGFVELWEQADSMAVRPDYLFHANGTGSTMAGLLAGKKLLGAGVEIISVDVSAQQEDFKESRARLGNAALEWLGAAPVLTPGDVHTDSGYYQPGYEQPNELSTGAIKTMALKEGIYLDPVYSGKGFSALIDQVRRGKIPRGSNVVFLHTGGATALFAEKEILGPLF